MSLPITDEVSAHGGPEIRGTLLVLVEICQRQKNRRMSLPKPSAAKKTALTISVMLFDMREPWLMRTWASTNGPAPNLKSSMPKPLIMRMWLQDWDYEEAMDFSGKCLKVRQNYG